jgi:tetratricopeptide (TPR) repeat protein
MSPFNVQDVLERANGSANTGDLETAESLLKRSLSEHPDERDIRFLLGTTLVKARKLDEAKDEFACLVEKNPEDIAALNNLAVIYCRQEKFLDALEILQQTIDIDPTKVELYYNLGNTYKHLADDKHAIMAYAKVVEFNPEFVPVYNDLGFIYQRMGEFQKSFAMFQQGLSLDADNPYLHCNYGIALEANGQIEEAADEYKAAFDKDVNFIDALNHLGIVWYKRGDYEKALESFDMALDINPYVSEVRHNIDVVYADQDTANENMPETEENQETQDKAAKLFMKVIEHAPLANEEREDLLVDYLGNSHIDETFLPKTDLVHEEDIPQAPLDDTESLPEEPIDLPREEEHQEVKEDDNYTEDFGNEDTETTINAADDANESPIITLIHLMKYLKGMVNNLPTERQELFRKSDVYLSIEYIINVLEGQKGLFKEIEKKLPKEVAAPLDYPDASESKHVVGTLSYLGSLASDLPDEAIIDALQRKVAAVLLELQEAVSPKEG